MVTSLSIVIVYLLFPLTALSFDQPQQRTRRPAPTPQVTIDQLRADANQTDGIYNRIKLYNRYILQFQNIYPDSTAILIDEIQNMKGLDEDERKGYSYLLKSNTFLPNNYDSVFYYAGLAKSLIDKEKDPWSYVQAGRTMNRYYNRNNIMIPAQEVYLDLIDVIERNEETFDDLEVLSIYQELGNLYSRVNATELALNLFNRLLKDDIPIDRECSIKLSISNTLARANRVQEAYDMLKPCSELEILPVQMEIVTYNTLGTLSRRMEEPAKAVEYFKKSLELTDFLEGQAPPDNQRQVFLGLAYLENGQIEQADSVKNVVEFSQQRMRPDQEIYKLIFYSRVELAKREYEASVGYADRAIQMAERMNMVNNLQDVHIVKSEALEALGRYDEALDVVREYNTMNKLRENFIREREMASANVRYQLTIRENELNAASETISQLSNRNKIIILITIIVIVGAVIIYYRNRINYLMKEEQTRNKIARDLHDDLSGTLSSISFFSEAAIRSTSEKKDSGQYLEMIDRSASEAKEKINDIIWAINPENDDWEIFVAKCRRFAADTFDSRDMNYTIKMDSSGYGHDKLQIRQELWLAFKEIITNVARHSEATEVSVNMTSDRNMLNLVISDNGKGISKEAMEKGNGLKNIEKRIREIDGKAELKTKEGEGTTWKISISD